MRSAIIIALALLFLLAACAPQYREVEVTNQTCRTASDCQLPMEYAVRSSCPFQNDCIEGRCTIICPDMR